VIVGVTGGTGFVGRAVVAELLQAGHETRVLSRTEPRTLPEGVRHVRGSVVTGEGLGELVQEADALIHLVGIIRESGPNTFKAVHHQGTVNAVIAASAAGVRKYLHMSALGTRGGARSRYHRSKWEGETAVRASGLAWTIFRPSTIFGPEDAFINMLARLVRRSPVIPVPGGTGNLMQPVAIRDVAASFTAALESDVTSGRTYELGGPDQLNLRQILEKLAQVLGKKRFFINIPLPVLAPFVKMASFLGIPAPMTPDQLLMLGEDNVRTGGDPVQELGIQWTPFEEGIKEYLGTGQSK